MTNISLKRWGVNRGGVQMSLVSALLLAAVAANAEKTAAKAANKGSEPEVVPTVVSIAQRFATFRCGVDAPKSCAMSTRPGTVLEGFKWGSSRRDVVNVYAAPDGIYDREFNPLLAKVAPGMVMQELELARENKKSALDQGFIEFADHPTGLDASPLRAEYTYRNGESALIVPERDARRLFFFFGKAPNDHFWKVYEELPLSEKTALGASFRDAVKRLEVAYGVPPLVRRAEGAEGESWATAEIQDARVHLRLVDRSREKIVGLVLEDRQTLASLPKLRNASGDDPFAIDPAVNAVTRGGISDPNAEKAPSATPPARKSLKKKK